MADAFGHTLPKEQLGTQPQVLGVFDEAEADNGALTGPKLLLRNTKAAVTTCRHEVEKMPVGGGVTHLSVETLYDCCLPHVAYVHGDLEATAEGFCVEEQYDGGFKLAADGRVHPGTDQHHPLQQPIRQQDTPTSI